LTGFIERIAKFIAPSLKNEAEIKDLVREEISRVRMSLPITANYDPKNEGYHPLTGGNSQRRDLTTLTHDRMFEIAYYMFDNSAMTRRIARLDKSFLFAEPITVTSDDEDILEVINRFWDDSANNMDLDFPEQMMWLSLLGEQCWPVEINKHNGRVTLGYIDPANIKEIFVSRTNVKQIVQVELRGTAGRPGQKMAAIRQDLNPISSTSSRLVGECFFFAINHPPNSPRGRSDFLTLFDWIDGLERYGFNYLERAENLLNFVWDITLKGMNEEQIREWLRDNPAPEPGSLRAHNEGVEWKAVAPDIKATDFRSGFDMGKSFIMGAAGRPESWFGGGGKAYQTEAEIFGQVPIKDLDERQLYIKHILNFMLRFVIDQAVIAGRLSEKKAEAGFTVNLPEISKRDLTKVLAGIPQFATALVVAENNSIISHETAVKSFALIAGQLGIDIDPEIELEAVKNQAEEKNFEDYIK